MAEKVLMKGNEALAEAAIRAGCRHFFGYPITPQTEVAAYMAKRMPQVGGTYLQAESEVAAINMVYGAAAAGVRAMTGSSSPGISLKSEGLSYIAACDLPAVIINIQRSSPGLGGIQPSQADYWQATKAPGHGDFHILVLAPSTIQEMCDLVYDAFDLSDQYRVPAMIWADGLLGQMMEPVAFPEGREPKQFEKPWALSGHQFQRPKNIVNSLYLNSQQLEDLIFDRYARYEEIKAKEQRFEEYRMEDAEYTIVAVGATFRIAKNAVDAARAKGIKVGLIRPITLWPFPTDAIEKAVPQSKFFLSVEMSTGQMVDDIRLVVNGRKPVHFFGHTGGIVPSPAEILKQIETLSGGVN